ncbi:hypothetical protein [Marinobacter salicampi]|uniref:hypothetical protein n=1 Tax=Marinobacter salicampi TaxID=435907 RepID=UPI00140B375D|nr:hypothetical protein [Marinobacter salicampi]
MSKTLVVETNAGSLFVEAPSFVAVKLTSQFIARLKELQDVSNSHDLTEVRCDVGLDWEAVESEMLCMPEMVVTSASFWFTAELKYAEETTVRSHSISSLSWNHLKSRFEAPDKDNLMVVAQSEDELRDLYLEKLAADEIV